MLILILYVGAGMIQSPYNSLRRAEARIFLSLTTSNQALSPGVKRQGREVDLHVMPSSRMAEMYLHCPICLHGVVLN
jgi:hypothetical protein